MLVEFFYFFFRLELCPAEPAGLDLCLDEADALLHAGDDDVVFGDGFHADGVGGTGGGVGEGVELLVGVVEVGD